MFCLCHEVQVNSLRRVRDKLYKYEIRATEPQSDFMRFKRCPSHSDIRFNIIFGRIDCQAFQTVKLSFYDFFDFNTK